MELLSFLQKELKEEKDKVRQIHDAAETEGRGVSAVERTAVEAGIEKMKELQTKIREDEERRAIIGLVDDFDQTVVKGAPDRQVEPTDAVSDGPNLGEAFVRSSVFKMLSAKYKENGGLPQNTNLSVHIPSFRVKAAGDPVVESDSTSIFGTGGASGKFTTLVPLEPPLQPAVTIADLIPSIPITVGNSASWPTVTTRTRASTTSVTEGCGQAGCGVRVRHLLEGAGDQGRMGQGLDAVPRGRPGSRGVHQRRPSVHGSAD